MISHVQKDHSVIGEPPKKIGRLLSDHILQQAGNQSYHKIVALLQAVLKFLLMKLMKHF